MEFDRALTLALERIKTARRDQANIKDRPWPRVVVIITTKQVYRREVVQFGRYFGTEGLFWTYASWGELRPVRGVADALRITHDKLQQQSDGAVTIVFESVQGAQRDIYCEAKSFTLDSRFDDLVATAMHKLAKANPAYKPYVQIATWLPLTNKYLELATVREGSTQDAIEKIEVAYNDFWAKAYEATKLRVYFDPGTYTSEKATLIGTWRPAARCRPHRRRHSSPKGFWDRVKLYGREVYDGHEHGMKHFE